MTLKARNLSNFIGSCVYFNKSDVAYSVVKRSLAMELFRSQSLKTEFIESDFQSSDEDFCRDEVESEAQIGTLVEVVNNYT